MSKRAAKGQLNAQQLRFCQEYIKDLNATQAAIRAGYAPKAAQEQSSRLLSKAIVKRKVQELMDARAVRVEVQADDVLRELSRIGYSDIRALFKEGGGIKDPTKWPEDLARAIASIEVEELFEGAGQDRIWIGYTKKVKFWDKPKALELMGKHLKLFTEKVEHSGSVKLEDLVAGSSEETKA